MQMYILVKLKGVAVQLTITLQGNEAYALKLVSYVGCVVSLVCLTLSLLILIPCG